VSEEQKGKRKQPTHSLGYTLRVSPGAYQETRGRENIGQVCWKRLSLTTFAVLVLVVVLINFIGEALLQAFDPRRLDGPG
jgi:ABC-type microcin C transport system permease subunit YejE